MSRPILEPGPDHTITIEPTTSRVLVAVGGRTLADSRSALTLQEASYPAVQYLPLADVDQSLLRPTATATYCPYKGECSYFTVVLPGGNEVPDAVWTYRSPYPAVAAIAGHVAFYPDRVDIAVEPRDGERRSSQSR